jgi:DNA-binding PadR family transcriptional regulator
MTQSPIREFEELVLLGVLITAPDAYGPTIQEALLEEAGRDVSLGAIYTALARLADKGLVTSEMGDPTPVRGGRRKRHYELTPAGLERVRETRRIRNRMWDRAALELKEGRVGS